MTTWESHPVFPGDEHDRSRLTIGQCAAAFFRYAHENVKRPWAFRISMTVNCSLSDVADRGHQELSGVVSTLTSVFIPVERLDIGIAAISRILEIFEVSSWNELVGKECRIVDVGGEWERPVIIGHLTREVWLSSDWLMDAEMDREKN